MAFYTIAGNAPADHGALFVAENATLAGAISLEEGSSIWYGAVLRADTGRIVVGAGTNIQDNAVLHTGPNLDIVLGRGVSVGHGAILHGCMIGDGCMIGMHATVLNGAVIGPGCLIAAGALISAVGYRVLFPYAACFAALAFVTMCFVRHGDVKAAGKRGLDAFGDME